MTSTRPYQAPWRAPAPFDLAPRSHDLGASCLCQADHRPAPLEYEWHHVRPLYLSGEDTRVGVEHRNGIWLCPTAHTNVHELLRLCLLRNHELGWQEAVDLYEPPVNRFCWLTANIGFRWWVTNTWGEA